MIKSVNLPTLVISAFSAFSLLSLSVGVLWLVSVLTNEKNIKPSLALAGISEVAIKRQTKEGFEALLRRFETIEPTKKKIDAASKLAEQKNQRKKNTKTAQKPKPIDKTLRKSFQQYDDNHQFGLAGIFEETQRFAVIQLINFESKQSTYHQLNIGDTLGAFQLKELTSDTAIMQQGETQLTLPLFKKNK